MLLPDHPARVVPVSVDRAGGRPFGATDRGAERCPPRHPVAFAQWCPTAAAERRTRLVRTRIISVAMLASVLAICLFGVPLGVAVLKYALQQERARLVQLASDVAISVAGHVYD